MRRQSQNHFLSGEDLDSDQYLAGKSVTPANECEFAESDGYIPAKVERLPQFYPRISPTLDRKIARQLSGPSAGGVFVLWNTLKSSKIHQTLTLAKSLGRLVSVMMVGASISACPSEIESFTVPSPHPAHFREAPILAYPARANAIGTGMDRSSNITIRDTMLGYVRPGEQNGELSGAFFWLMAFYFIYCARPQDYISVLEYLPMAKISGVLAAGSLFLSAGRTRRRFGDLPREASYLLWIIILLFASALLSPVWKGGAFFGTLDFAKVYIVWILTFMLVTTLERLRRVVFIQTASVTVISLVAIIKGHSVPRLNGVIGGFYSNPNDLAFGIVLTLPFCVAFLITTKSAARKMLWSVAIVAMMVALFLTASRAGFIDLAVSGAFCLWHFGVKGKRHSLIAATIVMVVLILAVAGGPLMKRFNAISGEDKDASSEAYLSYLERTVLMERAVDAIAHYPILGIGNQNFTVYSGLWREVHVSYLQIAAEAGVPALILYLMFFYRGFANLRRLGRSENLDGELDAFVGASRASLVGFLVGACFAPEAYQFFPYFAVCYTSALVAIGKETGALQSASSRNFAVQHSVFGNPYLNTGRSRAFYPKR